MIARRFRRLAVPLVLAVVALGLTSCSPKTSDVATVSYRDGNGEHTVHISRASFTKEVGELAGSTQFQTLLKSANFSLVGDQKLTTGTNLSATYLQQLVEQVALDAEVSYLKIPPVPNARDTAILHTKESFALSNEIGTDAQGNRSWIGPGAVYLSFPKSLQDALVARQIRADQLIDYFSTPTADKEKALYDQFSTSICPSGRQVAQILVKDVATANTILAQLQGGASFAQLAKTKSTDTTSGKVGGDVGCLAPGTFVKEFEAAAYGAPFDVPIGPVKSQFGYHIILVRHPTFADSQTDIDNALKQNPLVARDLRLRDMKVWISPQYGTGSVGVDSQTGTLSFRVTPPTAPAVRVCREDSAVCSGTTTTTTTTVPAGG